MNTEELKKGLEGMSYRELYARGVADGRELRRRGAPEGALTAESETPVPYACGRADGYFESHPPEEFRAQAAWYRSFSFLRDEKGTACEILPLSSLGRYKYVVTLSFFKGEILLSRKRGRGTWETQGGHIEPGETPIEAAKRELYEESGAQDYDIEPLCDYFAWDDVSSAGGMVFVARIRKLGALPESEMEEVRTFAALPDNLTYPGITPLLFAQANTQKES